MHFTEDLFEQAVIEPSENMGYAHIYAPDMEHDYSSPIQDAKDYARLIDAYELKFA